MGKKVAARAMGKSGSDFDPIAVLSRASEHLSVVEDVLKRSEIAGETTAHLTRNMHRLRERIDDRQLYVAVIGEFNAGKSTFINALLRDDFLVSAPVVSTATEYQIRHGKRYAARVRGQGGTPTVAAKAGDREGVRSFLAALAPEIESGRVERVLLTHPARFLSADVVIIDTPGLNATVPDHQRIAVKTVEHRADAAIVVMSADRPLPMSLLSFLKGPFRPFTHRAMFVIAKAWILSETQQARVANNVRDRLRAELDIEPTVALIAAGKVLEATQADDPWLRRFERLETLLIERLRRERSLAIAETCLRISAEMFDSLRQGLEQTLAAYRARQQRLRATVVQDIDGFTRTQTANLRRQIDSIRHHYLPILHKTHAEIGIAGWQAIEAAITGAGPEALKGVLAPEGSTSVEMQQSFAKNVQALSLYKALLAENVGAYIGATIDPAYREAYETIQTFGLQLAVMPTAVAITIKPAQAVGALGEAGTSIAAYNRIEEKLFTGAFWTAVAAGTVLTGGALGAVIGAIGMFGGGVVIGSYFFDRKKEKLIAGIREKFQGEYKALGQRMESDFNQYADQVRAEAEAWISTASGHYSKALAALHRAEDQRRRALERQEQAVHADIKALETRVQLLERQRHRLMKMSLPSALEVCA